MGYEEALKRWMESLPTAEERARLDAKRRAEDEARLVNERFRRVRELGIPVTAADMRAIAGRRFDETPAVKIVREWFTMNCEELDGPGQLFLLGPVGTGKTFAAGVLLTECRIDMVRAWYATEQPDDTFTWTNIVTRETKRELTPEERSARTRDPRAEQQLVSGVYLKFREACRLYRSEWGDEAKAYKAAINSSVLVIDELGTERDQTLASETLQDVVDRRQVSGRLTLYTSNCSRKNLLTRYDERTYDRMKSCAVIRELQGKSLREGDL